MQVGWVSCLRDKKHETTLNFNNSEAYFLFINITDFYAVNSWNVYDDKCSPLLYGMKLVFHSQELIAVFLYNTHELIWLMKNRLTDVCQRRTSEWLLYTDISMYSFDWWYLTSFCCTVRRRFHDRVPLSSSTKKEGDLLFSQEMVDLVSYKTKTLS